MQKFQIRVVRPSGYSFDLDVTSDFSVSYLKSRIFQQEGFFPNLSLALGDVLLADGASPLEAYGVEEGAIMLMVVGDVKDMSPDLLKEMIAVEQQSNPDIVNALRENGRIFEYPEFEREMAWEHGCLDEHVERVTERYLDFCRLLQELPKWPKTCNPSIAVIGDSGVGKTSLINAFAGRQVAEQETVDISRKYTSQQGVEYYDFPGECEGRAYTNLEYVMALRGMHLVIIVVTYPYSPLVLDMRMQLLRSCGIKCLVVNNKSDQLRLQSIEWHYSQLDEDAARESFGQLPRNNLFNTEEAAKECSRLLNRLRLKVQLKGEIAHPEMFYLAAAPDSDPVEKWATRLSEFQILIETFLCEPDALGADEIGDGDSDEAETNSDDEWMWMTAGLENLAVS